MKRPRRRQDGNLSQNHPSPTRKWWLFGVFVLAGGVAYFNSFQGAFVYDDISSISDNRHIRTLWPLSEAMSLPMFLGGETVSRRPLLSLSFALNHFLLGGQPWGYHLVNLAIHISAALLLFGIVRRTLALEPFRTRYGDRSVGLALLIAIIWLVHPLQTESVTYIVQRAESLMGMLYLLTIYCGLRSFQGSHVIRWRLASVLACLSGMAVKEVMVTAPLLLFLYDGMFVSSSFLSAWKTRWKFYAALAATWSLLLLLQILGLAEVSRDFTQRSPLTYALTQSGVILHYLRLSVWPVPLVMDYNWPSAQSVASIVPALCAIVLLLGVTAWGLKGRRWFGYLGAWFFLILAPTSSIVALNQNLEEHRMYLSLAAVIVLLVMGGDYLLGKMLSGKVSTLGKIACAALMILLATLTITRNERYHSEIALWTDNVEKRPDSYTAHNNLGLVLVRAERVTDAIYHYRQAIRIDPSFAFAHNNLGIALAMNGKSEDAIHHFHRALEINPKLADAHYNLGRILFATPNKIDEAIEHFLQAISINPNFAKAHNNLGYAYFSRKQYDEAIEHYLQAIMINPEFTIAHLNLGNSYFVKDEVEAAIQHYRRAIAIDPEFAKAHYGLGTALVKQEKLAEAIPSFRQAISINPIFWQAHQELGKLFLTQGERELANQHFEEADQIKQNAAQVQ